MESDTIKIESPWRAFGIKKVILNGEEYNLEHCASVVFEAIAGEIPVLKISYMPKNEDTRWNGSSK